MDFRQRIIDELKLSSLQADTLLKDYILVCEKLAKEYHSIQLLQAAVSKRFYCQNEHYDNKEKCDRQCVTCFSKE
jgi:hypothetical protein